MTSLCDTNWYPCKRDGSLQSAAEETQPATVYTKYQPTRKKPSEVVEFEISSAESFRSTNQFLARAAACSLDTFVSGIGLHAKGRVGRCCTRLLRFVVQCHSFGQVLWSVAIIWQGCGQSIALSFRENKYREAGARRRVYFNPQHAGMHTKALSSRKYTQMHAREPVLFGFSQWRNVRTHAQLPCKGSVEY